MAKKAKTLTFLLISLFVVGVCIVTFFHQNPEVHSAYILPGDAKAQNDCFTSILEEINGSERLKARELVESCLEIDALGCPGSLTALMEASRISNEKLLRLLIECGANLEATDRQGLTALFYAVGNRHLGMSKILLVSGANPNAMNDKGETALYFAVHDQEEALVRLLLEFAACPNVLSNSGFTPADLAKYHNNIVLYELLKYSSCHCVVCQN